MSETPAPDGIVVSVGDVTVTKAYQAEKFPVPAIEFVVESNREDDVLVRVVDYLPDTVAKDDLGFHPEFGAEHWTVAEDHIVFERTLAPGEGYTTVYGIRDVAETDVEEFLTEPKLGLVNADVNVEEIIGPDNSQVVREVLAGTAETVPGTEHAAEESTPEPIEAPDPASAEEDEDEIEPLELEDPPTTASDPATDEVATATEDARPDRSSQAEDESRGPSIMPGNVAAALATEIRQGRVSGDDLDALRNELERTARDDSDDVRISRLQSQVADLSAYTAALEDFIDENGPGRQLLDDLQNEFANVNDDLRDLNQGVESNGNAITVLENDSLELRDTIDSLDEETATVRGDLTDLEDDVLDVRGDVDELEGDVSRLDAALDDVVAEQEGQLTEMVEAREQDLSELQSTQAELVETVTEIKQWRDQLAGVFGGAKSE